jgi:hypothetical protein
MAEAQRDADWSDLVQFKQPASESDISDYVTFRAPTVERVGKAALDVAKQTGVGAAKGTTQLLGAPGVASRAAARGLETAIGAQPGMVPRGQPPMLPTPEEIQANVEQTTGPFREPQNPLEQMGENVGEAIPSAVAFGGNPLSNILRYAVPAGVGGSVAEALAPDALKPAAKTAGSLAGGGVGSLMRAGAPLRALRAQLPDYVDEQAILAAGALIRDAQRMQMTLTWPEALSQVTGRPVLSDVQRLLESARETRPRMGETQDRARRRFHCRVWADREHVRIAWPS